ncbi:hypothetical protein PDL71_06125 [Lacibacter sp. MH-610]|uniref:hypothetical protein n=1 Tax=Lacibacter sp. MH-610 TaxID=3020883 RepID=UPI003892007E
MKPKIYGIILLLGLIFLTVLLVHAVQNNRQLIRERQQLILKNDSLHIKQLEAKQKLAVLSKKIDSLTSNRNHIKKTKS